MDFDKVLRRRRMVRRYSAGPVTDGQLGRILAAARRGPSAGFAQGQYFVVVTGEAGRKAIAEAAGEGGYTSRGFEPWVSSAPAIVAVCTSEKTYADRYAEADKGGIQSWTVPYWHFDAGCAVMLMLLAAVNEGLAAGFLGAHGLPGLAGLLGLPPEVTPVGLVTIGHGLPEERTTSLQRGRRPFAEQVHWQKWDNVPPAPVADADLRYIGAQGE